MIKGDKIKLVKKMGAFDNIGEICEVTDVQEGGIICFRFGGCHLGCMSYDEYIKYFEPVEDIKKTPARVWTVWKTRFVDENEIVRIICYRHNGKRVQAMYGELRAESCCHATDTFDLEKGLMLAIKRLEVKIATKAVEDYVKTL